MTETPPVNLVGPTSAILEMEASPFYIKPNTLYKVTYNRYYQGAADVTCSVLAS